MENVGPACRQARLYSKPGCRLLVSSSQGVPPTPAVGVDRGQEGTQLVSVAGAGGIAGASSSLSGPGQLCPLHRGHQTVAGCGAQPSVWLDRSDDTCLWGRSGCMDMWLLLISFPSLPGPSQEPKGASPGSPGHDFAGHRPRGPGACTCCGDLACSGPL